MRADELREELNLLTLLVYMPCNRVSGLSNGSVDCCTCYRVMTFMKWLPFMCCQGNKKRGATFRRGGRGEVGVGSPPPSLSNTLLAQQTHLHVADICCFSNFI